MEIPAKAVLLTCYQFIKEYAEAGDTLIEQRIFARHLDTIHLCVRQSQPVYGKAAVKPCWFPGYWYDPKYSILPPSHQSQW